MKIQQLNWIAACWALCVLSAKADTISDITVPNFSFESVSGTSNYANQNPANNPNPTGVYWTDWTVTSANYQVFQTPLSAMTSPGTGQGTYFAEISLPYGYQSMTLQSESPLATIDNNATYTLTVALGQMPGTYSTEDTIELLAGNTVVAAKDVTEADLTNGTFTDWSASFNTLNGNNAGAVDQSLTVAVFVINSTFSYAGTGAIDNVRLTEDLVPEPSTWAMMLLGACGLAFAARRRLTS